MSALSPESVRGARRGIEKESLRVRPDGTLAVTPHAAALGSALTHPHITTDFSESQLELITGVQPDADACLAELRLIHQFVYRAIGEELLWVASMPCGLPGDDAIPIGRYGSSNVGTAKTVYRTGLAHRYGRRMQVISGIHYNFSLPGVSDDGYFALIRNFRRHGWLLFYLFGASPAACPSFVEGRPHGLSRLSEGSLYLPHATSLRMGRLGYQSDAQSSLAVSYNSLESYGRSLEDALTRPYPPYEKIGIRGPEGYRQLSTSLIQIENEFYGKIRPKRRIRTGERPLHALRERGVEYVEVRLMDLDPFEPLGINAQTMRFLDVFLLHCLKTPSPPDTPEELAAISRNQEKVAAHGREAGLNLTLESKSRGMKDWSREILEECKAIASALDAAEKKDLHGKAVASALAALDDPALTPSARVLEAMKRDHGNSYTAFVLAQSRKHRDALMALPFPAEAEARFRRMAEESLAVQRRIEASDKVDFETYRQRYLSPEMLLPSPER